MATYAIGDIQACYTEFELLLKQLRFDAGKDQLWLCGDLVGRGPNPLETLRTLRELGPAATIVLGNHDLHLLAEAAGVPKPGRRDKSLLPVLNAPDRQELMDWLRQQPLLHVDKKLGYGMVHAGLAPQWNLRQARNCAAEVEAALRGESYRNFLRAMYGNKPDRWKPSLSGKRRLRFITNCLTRLRFCYPDGRLALNEKGSPRPNDEHLLPWFAVPDRRSIKLRWVFGHWSTLGRIKWRRHKVYGLDTGCIWGGALTALCLETGVITQVPRRSTHKRV